MRSVQQYCNAYSTYDSACSGHSTTHIHTAVVVHAGIIRATDKRAGFVMGMGCWFLQMVVALMERHTKQRSAFRCWSGTVIHDTNSIPAG